MNTIDLTSIVLGLLTFVNGFGWFFDRRKHKEEVEGMKNDNMHKEMDLAKKYVDEYDRTIAERLRNDVKQLRNDLDQMKDELDQVKKNVCYRPNCHLRINGVHDQPEDGDGGQK